VISYLQDFLFSPDRLRQPVKALSGGEQNRLILARLFSKPANLLVLDEPTNDLDLETLELLEELLLNYEGTLLLVSHDREFLDNVVTSCIVFEGHGKVKQYVGGYRDWLKHGGSFETNAAAPVLPGTTAKPQQQQPAAKAKLSYRVQKELEDLPLQIETAEKEIKILEEEIAGSGFFQRPLNETEPVIKKLGKAQQKLEQLYQRWEELEHQQ
jgi:ATP-binding cassette subfamily F protein uup